MLSFSVNGGKLGPLARSPTSLSVLSTVKLCAARNASVTYAALVDHLGANSSIGSAKVSFDGACPSNRGDFSVSHGLPYTRAPMIESPHARTLHCARSCTVFSTTSHAIYRRLADWIVPSVRPSQMAYHEFLDGALEPGSDWLDLGCGHQIMPPWVGADEPNLVSRCHSVAGIDVDFASLEKNQIFSGRVAQANLEQIPFADESFDLVTANMVIEHLSEPLQVLNEVRRVLRPGGRFLYHTPNRNAPAMRIADRTPDALKKRIVWWLERREESDIFKTFYRMNTVEDITALADAAGLKVQRLVQMSSSAITYRLGPFALPELLFLRALEADRFKHLRTNVIATLEK